MSHKQLNTELIVITKPSLHVIINKTRTTVLSEACTHRQKEIEHSEAN